MLIYADVPCHLLKDRPQEDVRQPEVTYVTFSVYQRSDVKTLTHVKPFDRLNCRSTRRYDDAVLRR